MNVGDMATDFTLKDHNGNDVKLSEVKGKRVLLSFHPLAWTEICAKQMQSLESNEAVFNSLNMVAFGVSVDSVPCKKAWADSLGIKKVQLLSDFWPHGDVASSYSIFRKKNGFSERANIILDVDHKVAFIKIYEISKLPDITEIVEALKQI
jgi:peroxiredoxin